MNRVQRREEKRRARHKKRRVAARRRWGRFMDTLRSRRSALKRFARTWLPGQTAAQADDTAGALSGASEVS